VKPISFHEKEVIFNAPKGEEDEIDPLPVLPVKYEDGYDCLVSCWKPNWKDRLKILFGKPVYLSVVGTAQPPVLLSVDKLW
jgi:hypothetical protein